jgi:hypothetical protein
MHRLARLQRLENLENLRSTPPFTSLVMRLAGVTGTQFSLSSARF